jgi:Zn-dependent protease with chaperone function
MPFLLMLFLTLACLPEIEDWPPPFAAIASPAWSSALTWLGVGLTTAWAYGLSRRLRRALAANPSRRDRAQYRYARRRFFHLFGLVGTYGLALYVLGWGWAVGQFWTWAGSGRLLPGAELVLLTPFLAGLLLSWTFFYDAERALNRASERAFEADPLARAFLEQEKADLTAKIGPVEDQGFWGRWSYVAFHARQNLTLVLVPVLLLVAEKELRRQFPEMAQEWQVGAGIAGLVVALSVFAGMPWIVRLMLGLRPMPAGRLRDRLLATAKRLNFRLSDLLVWNTRGAMATAMVVGVLPWPRYVLFTDRLLTDLSEDEIEAVFGHEAGHVKHHHMVYYLAFLLTSMAVLGILATVYLPELISLPSHRHLEALPFVGCLGAYVFVIFGFLSRRCERQADVFGCRAVSCQRPDCVGHGPGVALAPRGQGLCPVGIRTFIQALEKVAISNGISRDRPGFLQSWQHSTIARRVEFLQRVLTDPAAEPRFQRAVLVVKWVMFLSLAGVLALLIGVVGWNKVTM